MKRRCRLCMYILLLTVIGLGCAKKPPQTPATLDIQTQTLAEGGTVAPSRPMAEPVTTRSGSVDSEILSEDLDELNRYVKQEGLLTATYFDFDRAELRAEARDQLVQNARFLREHPEIVVTVEGHCDERGTAEYNLALGENRASSVTDYLVSLGVDSRRLRNLSYGEERPSCTESREECWWRNRRADFVITGRKRS